MNATLCLAVMVAAWAIAIVYMARAGGALYVDSARVSRDLRQVLKGGVAVKLGYYRLGNKSESTHVATAELEQILDRFATPAAHHAEIVKAYYGNVVMIHRRNIAAELMPEHQANKIQTLRVECHDIRAFGRSVAVDRQPVDLKESYA